MSGKPEISVIVATYNRCESLRQTLLAMASQDVDPQRYELIVVDDGSADATEACCARFAEDHPAISIRYIRHGTNKRKAAACNTGIESAHADLVAFIDDDIRPVPCWLQAHLDKHRALNADVAVTGIVLYPDEWDRRSNWVRFANSNYLKNIDLSDDGKRPLPPTRFAGGNTSLRRETLLKVGMFNVENRRFEDVEMGFKLHRIGVPLLCETRAIVYHYAEAIQSIDATVKSFRRAYEMDREMLRAAYPGLLEQYGHWFLEPVDRRRDGVKQIMVKAAVRLAAHRPLQRVALMAAKMADGFPHAYFRPLYQYILVCEAVDAIRASVRTNQAGGK